MPHDPVLVAESQAWISKAREDLEAAETLLERQPALCSAAAFHTQQAAEKVLKSFLAWSNQPFRKIHSLVELGEQCARLDQSLAEFCKQTVPISGWAVESRYPGDWVLPGLEEVSQALETVRALFEAILSRLSEEHS